jgi:hypothetical protein
MDEADTRVCPIYRKYRNCKHFERGECRNGGADAHDGERIDDLDQIRRIRTNTVVTHTTREKRLAIHLGYRQQDGEPRDENSHYPTALTRTVYRSHSFWECLKSYDNAHELYIEQETALIGSGRRPYFVFYFPGPWEYNVGSLMAKYGYNVHYYRPRLFPQDRTRPADDRRTHVFNPNLIDGDIFGFTNDCHVSLLIEFDAALRSGGLWSSHRLFDGVGVESIHVPPTKVGEEELPSFNAPAAMWYTENGFTHFFPSPHDSCYTDELHEDTLHHATRMQSIRYGGGYVNTHVLRAGPHTEVRSFFSKYSFGPLRSAKIYMSHVIVDADGAWSSPDIHGIDVHGIVANRFNQQKSQIIYNSLRRLRVSGTMLEPVLRPYVEAEFDARWSALKLNPVPHWDARSEAASQIFSGKFSELPPAIVELGYALHEKQSLVQLFLNLAQLLKRGALFMADKIKSVIEFFRNLFRRRRPPTAFVLVNVNEYGERVGDDSDIEIEQLNLFGMLSALLNKVLVFKSFKKKVVSKIQNLGFVKKIFSTKMKAEDRFPKASAFLSMVKTMLLALMRAFVPAVVEELAKSIPILGPILGFLEFMAEIARFFYDDEVNVIETGFSSLFRLLFHGLSSFFLPFPIRLAIHATMNLFLRDPYEHNVAGEKKTFNFFSLLAHEIQKFRRELAYIDGAHNDAFLPDYEVTHQLVEATATAADTIAKIDGVDDLLICRYQTRGGSFGITLEEALAESRKRQVKHEFGHNIIRNPILTRPQNTLDQALVGLYLRYLREKAPSDPKFTSLVVQSYVTELLDGVRPVPTASFAEVEDEIHESFTGMKLRQYEDYFESLVTFTTRERTEKTLKMIIKSDETLPVKLRLIEGIRMYVIKNRFIYPIPKESIVKTMYGYLHGFDVLSEHFRGREFYYKDGLSPIWTIDTFVATFESPKYKNPKAIGEWATRAVSAPGIHLNTTGDDNYAILHLPADRLPHPTVVSFDVESFDFHYTKALLDGHVLISEKMQILKESIDETVSVALAGIHLEYRTIDGESVKITLDPEAIRVFLKSGEYVTVFKAANLSLMAQHHVLSVFSRLDFGERTTINYVEILRKTFRSLGFNLKIEEYDGLPYAPACVPTFLSLAMVMRYKVVTPTMFSPVKLFVLKKDPMSIFGGNPLDPIAQASAMGKLLGAISHANVFGDPLGVAIRRKMADIAENHFGINVERAYKEYLARTGESEYSSYAIKDIDPIDHNSYLHYMVDFGQRKGDPFPLASYISSVREVANMSVSPPPMDLDGFIIFPVEITYVEWASHHHYGADRDFGDDAVT